MGQAASATAFADRHSLRMERNTYAHPNESSLLGLPFAPVVLDTQHKVTRGIQHGLDRLAANVIRTQRKEITCRTCRKEMSDVSRSTVPL